MRRPVFPAIVFLLTITGGGLLCVGVLFIPDDAVSPPPHVENLGELLSGEYTAEIDQFVETNHPFHDPAVNLVTAVRLALFREGSGPVVVDRAYRLFTEEEFEHHPEDRPELERRIEWIESIAQFLADDGVVLMVVLLPSKARVQQEFLADYRASLAQHWRYDAAYHALSESFGPSAIVVDPRATLAETSDSFFRTDTHWSSAGVFAVANQIAREFASTGGLPLQPETEYRVRRDRWAVRDGDLVQFLPLGFWRRFFPIKPDTVEYRVVEMVTRGNPGGLFDQPVIPVALVGTSFSAGDVWDFPGALQYVLQAEVLNVAEEGLGPFVPMQQYLGGDTYRDVPPSLVVWEIPERYLTLPDVTVPELPET